MVDQQDNRGRGRLGLFQAVLAGLLVGVVGLLGFARFGDPRLMPPPVLRLALALKNPRASPEVPVTWSQLCIAWDSWLGSLHEHAPRLLRTEDLWAPDDPLHAAVEEFAAHAQQFRPEVLIPEARTESRLRVLAGSPPRAVVEQLRDPGVYRRVDEAGMKLRRLATRLETWARWSELRALLRLCRRRGFDGVAAVLERRLPPQPGDLGFALDLTRTMTHLNELSLDRDGALKLAARWGEFTRLAAILQGSPDPEQQAVPARVLDRLGDQATLGGFADSLAGPVEEMRRQAQNLAVARNPSDATVGARP